MFRHPEVAAKRPIQVGCCRLGHFNTKSGKPDFAGATARAVHPSRLASLAPQDDGERSTKQRPRRILSRRACADSPHMAMIAAVFERVYFRPDAAVAQW